MLSFGKPKASPRGYNSESSPVFRKERDCGKLAAGERCELLSKEKGEMYSSYVYKIFSDGKLIKIRKLATSIINNKEFRFLHGTTAISKEAAVYGQLKGFPEFKRYCFPYIGFKMERGNRIRYIDFEYLKGETLQDYYHRHKVNRDFFLRQCIQCLLFLANHGYIHGDIKMDNFWYDPETKEVRIFDFEKAKKNPEITQRDPPISLVEETDSFINLLEKEEEFEYTADEVRGFLGGTKSEIMKMIATSPTKEDGFRNLIGLYNRVLSKLSAKSGGARRFTQRKKRDSK